LLTLTVTDLTRTTGSAATGDRVNVQLDSHVPASFTLPFPIGGNVQFALESAASCTLTRKWTAPRRPPLTRDPCQTPANFCAALRPDV
jgi:hypothetical protein